MPIKSVTKDHLGALICILLGAGTLGLGWTYGIGTLTQMGPGFVPVGIGALLVLVGVVIALTASRPAGERFIDAQRGKSGEGLEWRGWVCIVGALVAFVVLGRWGGLVPASLVTVFVAALGDRKNTVRSAGVLALVMTAFAVLVFHYLLGLQLPMFGWG
jgi:hypothetical protein